MGPILTRIGRELRDMSKWSRALAGLAAGGAGIGASEAAAAALPGVTSPVLAVANRIIDWTPRQLKELAIEQLGTKDKPVLLASVIGGMIVSLALAGMLGKKLGTIAFTVLTVVAGALVLADRATSAGTSSASSRWSCSGQWPSRPSSGCSGNGRRRRLRASTGASSW
jgi:hypothetical protein